MKLNFLLAAAFVAAPVLAASSTTTQYGYHDSIKDSYTNKRQHIDRYCQGFLQVFQGRRCPHHGR